jgi:predicted HD superfamily hydrolase involved in NAD metabolism
MSGELSTSGRKHQSGDGPRTSAAQDADLIVLFREQAQTLPDWLRGHLARVVAEGRRLAQIHEVDIGRVQAAAWGHDLYRAHSDDQLLDLAQRFGISPGPEERAAPILLHGPVAARRAELEWGVVDADVLEAIHWHTSARPALSAVAQVVFVADKIEPDKVAADPGLGPIRTLADHDLDAATAALLERRIALHLATSAVIHPASVEARNYYLRLD